MKVRALIRTDTRLGIPVCFFLTTLRRLFSFNRTRKDVPDQPRKIAFLKLAEQGSTVLAYPAFKRAVNLVGRKNVYVLVLEDNRFILDLLDAIPAGNVITLPQTSLFALFAGAFSAVVRLRRLGIDTTIDLEFFARGSAILAFLSGAKRRIGFHAFSGSGPYRGDLLTHRLLYNPHLHTTDTFVSLVEAVTRSPEQLPTFNFIPKTYENVAPIFQAGAAEVEEVKALLGFTPSSDEPLIILNPNASDLLPLRRWPAEKYVTLAKAILSAYPTAEVAFTGASEEAETTNKLVEQVGSLRCFSLAGKTTLRQLLVLYTLADVLVTNDSGPAHFATLTSIRVVTLFGPETPRLFAARSPRNRVLWAGLACSPCISAYNCRQSACHNNVCMQVLRIEMVFTAVVVALEQRKRTAAEKDSLFPSVRQIEARPVLPL